MHSSQNRSLVVAILLALILSAFFVAREFTRLGPTGFYTIATVSGCTNITDAGVYTLNSNVANSTADSCINISVSNVILEGAGYTIDGTDNENNDEVTSGIYIYNASATITNVTIRNLKVTDWYYGIRLRTTNNSFVTNATGDSNTYDTIYLQTSHNNTLENNTATSNIYAGIHLQGSKNNTIINNSLPSGNTLGISLLLQSHNNTIVNNTAVGANRGIVLSQSNLNTLTNNTASSNTIEGIYITSSNNNTLINNTVRSNSSDAISLETSNYASLYNNSIINSSRSLFVTASSDAEVDHTIDTTNKVDGIPIYYIKNNQTFTYDHTISMATLFCIWCNNITITNVTFVKQGYGVFFWKTNNSRIQNSNLSFNFNGMRFYFSVNNTIANNILRSNNDTALHFFQTSNNNTISDNIMNSNDDGPYLESSHNNTFTNNTANSNTRAGLSFYSSNNNTIRNNTANSNGVDNFYLEDSNNNSLTNNVANSGSMDGIYTGGGSNTLLNNTANSNARYGFILMDNTDLNTFTNNTASSNSEGDIYMRDSPTNVFQNQTISSSNYPTKISFTALGELIVKGVTSPPSTPSGRNTTNKYVNLTNLTTDLWIELNISYGDVNISNISRSTIFLARHNGTWETTPSVFASNTTYFTAQDYVYSNITGFSGIYAVFGTPIATTTTIPELQPQIFELLLVPDENKTFNLRRQDSIKVIFGNTSYTIKMKEIIYATRDYVLDITSQPAQIKLKEGESKDVDLNGDGIVDIRLTFIISISDGLKINLKSLSPPATTTTIANATAESSTTSTTPEMSEQIAGRSSEYWIVLLVIAPLIAIFLYEPFRKGKLKILLKILKKRKRAK